jgi:glycosyltransferase involved in cell wall biosynthesis
LETQYGVEMQQLARQIEGLGGIVHFTGMLSGDAKWGALYGCEGFILPSHQENFGIAVAEALACSKPVLISNQVNIWREIEQAGAGIVKSDDLIGTTAMLNSWSALTDQQKSEMPENGHACYVNSFQTGPAAEKFLKAISLPAEPVTI